VAYATFKNFIDGMQESVMPSRIDRSVMPGQSGANQTYILAALKFFDLTDEKAAPTDHLKALVEGDEKTRAETLKKIVEHGYAFIFKSDLDLQRATEAQLHEKFIERGLAGDTIRKCHSFFVNAADDAGIALGKHLKPRSRGQGVRTARRRSKRRTTGDFSNENNNPPEAIRKTMREMLLEKFPEYDPNWPAEIQTKWFAGFEKLMKAADEDRSE
jgi:hypothetical protein